MSSSWSHRASLPVFLILNTTVGLLANSVVLGAPLWVFFLQGPALFQFLGRNKFLPPMMRLTRLLFRWTLPVSCAIVYATEVMRVNHHAMIPPPKTFVNDDHGLLMATLSLGAVLVNALIVVPRALKAGQQATLKKQDDDKTTPKARVAAMAISGGDANQSTKSVTRTLHQTVVLLVVIMWIGSVGYVYNTVTTLASLSPPLQQQ